MKENKLVLTNEQINTFRVLLDNIELVNISPISTQIKKHCLNESDYSRESVNFNLELANKENDPIISENNLLVTTKIRGKLEDGEKILFEMNFTYLTSFVIKNKKETVVQILEDKTIAEFFVKNQITKFIWPYLREDVSSSMIKYNLTPVFLPMHK